MSVEIRGYNPAKDHAECRSLWVEMAEDHRRLYRESVAGGDADSGAAFEEYLTKLKLSGMWVAVAQEQVVGFTGLLIDGRGGEVEPLVVAEAHRDEGIGTALLERLGVEAERRGLRHLTIHPAARNVAGLRCVHDAGFTTLSQVTLVKDLTGSHQIGDGEMELHGLRFDS